MNKLVLFLASGFYSGYAPHAPGTAGTLVGIALYILLSPLSLKLYGILTIGILLVGVWVSDRVEAIRGEKDSSLIVIDEIAGFLVAMFGLPLHGLTVAAGFVLFRIFDIAKPFPIRMIDRRLPGGWGVMLDDILAGVYTNIVLRVSAGVFFS